VQFDHLGLVSRSLADGRAALEALLLVQEWTREITDPVNRVCVQFGRDSSGVCYELIAPLGADSPIAKTLRSGKNILNHVAYLVPDLAAGRERLRAAGAVPTAIQASHQLIRDIVLEPMPK
jgi:methylmalonyl-CoA/ethylmalonyl-CoA epimerase